ncbi:MAG: heavy metal translocating P-type ATPase [Ardenticatenaceae bacterium]
MLKEKLNSLDSSSDEEQDGVSFAYQESMTGWSLENPDHYLAVSGISLALSTLALLFPSLNLLGLPGFLYASLPVYRKAYQELKRGEARVSMMVAIIMGGLVLTNHFWVGNFTVFMRVLSIKLTQKVQRSSQQDLIDLFKLQPRTVRVLEDGVEREIPFERLRLGDLVVIHAGQVIPVDGTIVDGIASIDQQILTGESQPAEKEVGHDVFASTVVLSGQLCVRVEKAGDKTIVAQITKILNDAATAKISVQLRSEEITDKTALPTLVASGLSLPFLGVGGALAILSAHFKYQMTVLAPLTMLNYLHWASKNGVLIKEGITIELLSQVDTLVFDKTGTLTEEVPHVGKVHLFANRPEDEICRFAAAAEYKQTHPIARAIQAEAKTRQLQLPEIDESDYKVGYGLKVTMGDQLIRVGSLRFMEMEEIPISPLAKQAQENSHQQGHSLVMVALNESLIGALEMHATVRKEVKEVIGALRKNHKIKSMYIISGDHDAPTKRLAQKLGIEHYFAETLPQNKAQIIKQLQQAGQFVCYIGDGINDSIALQQSQVSISMRGASSIATDTARIILMDGSLNQLPKLFEIGREFNLNVNRSWVIVLLTTFVNMSGVLFMGLDIVGTVIINRISLVVCLFNIMLPVLKQQIAAKPLDETGS